jgi:hypothetical protein
MADFVYTTVPGKIKLLLNKIREVGVPQKATVQWLKTVGFKSSNDVSLIGILKFIGFTDSSGVPTSKWTQYRGANHKHVLGDAVREGYADLFAVYPDANNGAKATSITSSVQAHQVENRLSQRQSALLKRSQSRPSFHR